LFFNEFLSYEDSVLRIKSCGIEAASFLDQQLFPKCKCVISTKCCVSIGIGASPRSRDT